MSPDERSDWWDRQVSTIIEYRLARYPALSDDAQDILNITLMRALCDPGGEYAPRETDKTPALYFRRCLLATIRSRARRAYAEKRNFERIDHAELVDEVAHPDHGSHDASIFQEGWSTTLNPEQILIRKDNLAHAQKLVTAMRPGTAQEFGKRLVEFAERGSDHREVEAELNTSPEATRKARERFSAKLRLGGAIEPANERGGPTDEGSAQ
jgi:hypothetical protein